MKGRQQAGLAGVAVTGVAAQPADTMASMSSQVRIACPPLSKSRLFHYTANVKCRLAQGRPVQLFKPACFGYTCPCRTNPPPFICVLLCVLHSIVLNALKMNNIGPGIPPEDQARLFIPFTRLDQVRARGHGLALPSLFAHGASARR